METTLQPATAEQSNGPLFCKDCVHYTQPLKDFARCSAPQVRQIDLVKGFYAPRCSDERDDRRPNQCGSAGKLFLQAGPNSVAGLNQSATDPIERRA